MPKDEPKCGEIWAIGDGHIRWINQEGAHEGETDKERFVLIATRQTLIERDNPSYLLVIPMSSKASRSWDYKLDRRDHVHSNLTKTTSLRLLMMQPIHKDWLVRRVGCLEPEVLKEILNGIAENLGLHEVGKSSEGDLFDEFDNLFPVLRK